MNSLVGMDDIKDISEEYLDKYFAEVDRLMNDPQFLKESEEWARMFIEMHRTKVK